jgi:hypothetical protein
MSRCTFFRRHSLGVVQKDGYQYCSRCGKALLAPCPHNWILISEIEHRYDWSYVLAYGPKENTTIRTYECSKCKDIKKEEV